MAWKDWALEEIRRAGLYDKDFDYGGEIGKCLEELVDVFAKQDHSGFSASWVASLFYRLVKWKPLFPITNNPEEWMAVAERNGEILYKSRRCPFLFATESQLKKNQAEDTGYYYKVDEQRRIYQDKDCRKIVELPYMPPTEPELLWEVQ